MSIVRRVLVILSAFVLVISAFPCFAADVDYNHVNVDISWLYLEPTGGPADFASTNIPQGNSVQGKIFDTDPNYRSGYRIQGGYHLDRDNDFQAHYTHFDKRYSSSVASPGRVFPIDALFFAGIPFDAASATTKYKYQEYGLDYGHWFQVFDPFKLRAFIGLSYVDYSDSLYADYTVVNTTSIATHGLENDFHGIGPFIGLNGIWHLTSGFALTGKLSGGVLIGKNDLKGVVLNNPTPPPVNAFNVENNRDTNIPFFIADLGLEYAFHIKNQKLSISAGCEFMHYNNIVKRDATAVTGDTISSNDLDFGGFYLSASIAFA